MFSRPLLAPRSQQAPQRPEQSPMAARPGAQSIAGLGSFVLLDRSLNYDRSLFVPVSLFSGGQKQRQILLDPSGSSIAAITRCCNHAPTFSIDGLQSLIVTAKIIAAIIRNPTSEIKKLVAHAWKECPNCKYHIYNGDVRSQWQGLPVGVKFEPSDQELLTHLDGKVGSAASHAQIDDFIPTIEEVEGICYTHPENLPGTKMNGSSSHFFHRVSNEYDVGQRKRRKISSNNRIDSDEPIRWHKTGQSKPIFDNGVLKGWKKIPVLHKGKKVKTNWTLHQFHLGAKKDEKHGELVVSRVFWQVKSNNTGKSQMHVADVESGSCDAEIDPKTPNMYPKQPRRLSGSPFETDQNQDEEEPGSPAVQDFAALPLQREADIHENPVPQDNPSVDSLPGFPDLDCTFHFPELFNLTDNPDWLNGNEA
uniref:Uncharacterized protein n=1 Tax=Avena sativa TaxID=4498 RepID=A0ACD5URJ9_AVESA